MVKVSATGGFEKGLTLNLGREALKKVEWSANIVCG
jgi:hypothetical protein